MPIAVVMVVVVFFRSRTTPEPSGSHFFSQAPFPIPSNWGTEFPRHSSCPVLVRHVKELVNEIICRLQRFPQDELWRQLGPKSVVTPRPLGVKHALGGIVLGTFSFWRILPTMRTAIRIRVVGPQYLGTAFFRPPG